MKPYPTRLSCVGKERMENRDLCYCSCHNSQYPPRVLSRRHLVAEYSKYTKGNTLSKVGYAGKFAVTHTHTHIHTHTQTHTHTRTYVRTYVHTNVRT